jgi:hypothetical protein
MLPMPTRDDLPELWGVSEIRDFANEQLAEDDRPPVSKQSVAAWCQAADFPKPAFTLKMGNAWVADEVTPWVLDRLARPSMRTGRAGNAVDRNTRMAIAALEGKGRGLDEVAAQFGVSRGTVARIWRQQREEH